MLRLSRFSWTDPKVSALGKQLKYCATGLNTMRLQKQKEIGEKEVIIGEEVK